jgi:hypothetical protein
LLADPRTLLLVAFDGKRPDNGPANALYRSAGGATDSVTVEWTFSYVAD